MCRTTLVNTRYHCDGTVIFTRPQTRLTFLPYTCTDWSGAFCAIFST